MSRSLNLTSSILQRVAHGDLTLGRAAELLGLSYRHARRLYRRYRDSGTHGLVHGLTGRRSNRSVDDRVVKRAVRLYVEHYAHLGPTRASVALEDEHGITINRETLRRALIRARLWPPRRRDAGDEPIPRFGEVIVLNVIHLGVHGDSVPDRRRNRDALFCLFEMATGLSRIGSGPPDDELAPQTLVRRWTLELGLPERIMVPRLDIFTDAPAPTIGEQLTGITPANSFARMCERLGVELEVVSEATVDRLMRRHCGDLKKRLERRLSTSADVSDEQSAAERTSSPTGAPGACVPGGSVRHPSWLLPPGLDDAHVLVRRETGLDDAFGIERVCLVRDDGTVSVHGTTYAFTAGSPAHVPSPGDTVAVRLRPDGPAVAVWHGRRLELGPAAAAGDTEQDSSTVQSSRPNLEPHPPFRRESSQPETRDA